MHFHRYMQLLHQCLCVLKKVFVTDILRFFEVSCLRRATSISDNLWVLLYTLKSFPVFYAAGGPSRIIILILQFAQLLHE